MRPVLKPVRHLDPAGAAHHESEGAPVGLHLGDVRDGADAEALLPPPASDPRSMSTTPNSGLSCCSTRDIITRYRSSNTRSAIGIPGNSTDASGNMAIVVM